MGLEFHCYKRISISLTGETNTKYFIKDIHNEEEIDSLEDMAAKIVDNLFLQSGKGRFYHDKITLYDGEELSVSGKPRMDVTRDGIVVTNSLSYEDESDSDFNRIKQYMLDLLKQRKE